MNAMGTASTRATRAIQARNHWRVSSAMRGGAKVMRTKLQKNCNEKIAADTPPAEVGFLSIANVTIPGRANVRQNPVTAVNPIHTQKCAPTKTEKRESDRERERENAITTE